MKTVILCDNSYHAKTVFTKKVLSRLMTVSDLDGVCYTKKELYSDAERFKDTEVIFSTWGMPYLSEEEIDSLLPALKCVFYAAGSVQGFARPFLNRGVRVFSAWAANAVPVAEYATAQIILAGKDFYCQSRLGSVGRWQDARERRGSQIGNYHKRVGLIGCGMIGSMVAKRLKAFDVEVLAYDPFLSSERANELGVSTVTLSELFSCCEVVSNHLANNESTKRLLGYERFMSMPPYSVFINTGRGAQVDEEGLCRALKERPDLSAVLDVTEPEPPVEGHPFYKLENCFLTPHIAGSLGNELARMSEYMALEYESFVSGGACRYEITLEMLKTMA